MVDPFPSAPKVWASSHGEGSNLPALYSAVCGQRGFRSPHLAWNPLRSVDDPDAVHRAGVRWPNPVDVEAVHLCWPKGFEPTSWRVCVERGGACIPATHFAPATGAETTIALAGAPITGIVIEQAAGGGSAAHPGELRIDALALTCAARPDFEVQLIDAAGAVHTPAMPLATDGCATTVLDISDVPFILVRARQPTPVLAISLGVVRIAGVGHPDDLRAWIAALSQVQVEGPGGELRPAPIKTRRLDALSAGKVAGTVHITLSLAVPIETRAVRVALPMARGGIMALSTAALLDTAPETGDTVPFDAPNTAPDWSSLSTGGDVYGERFRADGEWTLQAARRAPLDAQVRGAVSLGVPGQDVRVGVGPDGGIQIAPRIAAPNKGSRGRCLHMRAALEHASGTPRRTFDPDAPGVTLETNSSTWGLRQEIFVDPGEDGVPVLQWWLEVSSQDREGPDATVSIGAAMRDLFWPLTLPWQATAGGGALTLRWSDGTAALDTDDGWRVSLPKASKAEWVLSRTVHAGRTARFGLRFHLTPTLPIDRRPRSPLEGLERLVASVQARTVDAVTVRLPDRVWDRLLHRLLATSTLFIQSGERATYGIYPSVYAGSVFGLEEDYLFRAWAQWGMGAQAMASFKATTLTPKHLDKRHYLHDLRNGLTLWQAQRLAAITGQPWGEAFDPDQRAMLDGLGQWIVDQRATPTERADGFEILPGLLPPHRFGGDLSFATQSFSANAANLVGLEALARATDRHDLRAEAQDYRRALLAAFDAVRVDTDDGPFLPMDSGGGDPGAYYQLFASGVLFWVGLFAPDDPRADLIEAALERDDRLFFGLPRFDDWGSPRAGIDAVYALGYLLRALQKGRREVFWTGLHAMATHAMDPDMLTFREVTPIQLAAPRGHRAHLPARRLDRSEPCIGALGGLLLLLRAALVQERPEPDGQPGPHLRLLGGALPDWWDEPGLTLQRAPTLGGPVSMSIQLRGEWDRRLHIDAPDAASIQVQLPDWAERATLEGGSDLPIDPDRRVTLPPGNHVLIAHGSPR